MIDNNDRQTSGPEPREGLVTADYASYLSQHDIVYHTPATTASHGFPLGDGENGALFWMPSTGPRWELGRCDLWDDGPERPFGSWNEEDEEVATALRSAGNVSIKSGLPMLDWTYMNSFESRLELHSARAYLKSVTPFGQMELKTWVNADPGVLVIDYSDQLDDLVPRIVHLGRWGSRVFGHWYRTIVRDPSLGIEGIESGSDMNHVWIVQETRSSRFAVAMGIDAGDSYATALREHRRGASMIIPATRAANMRIYVAIVSSEEIEKPGTAADPLDEAMTRVDIAKQEGADALYKPHKKNWAAFWNRSFVSIPDKYLENLWYINHYLMGSGSRGKYPPHFINGIWNPNRDSRPWNHYYHWNQEELGWPVAAAGHPELAHGYLQMRRTGLPRAVESARRMEDKSGAVYTDVFDHRGYQDEGIPLYSPGLQIALDAWRYWRHTGSESFLIDIGWPLMKEVCRFYLEMLEQGDDGLYHMPASHPYEHAAGYMVRDSITDMAHIRTAFPAAAEIAQLMDNESFAAELRDVSANLAPPTTIPIPRSHLDGEGSDGKFAVGAAKGQVPPSGRMISAGQRVDDGVHVYFRANIDGIGSEPLFPGANEAAIYPSGTIGLKDRGSELFDAARTTLLANWDGGVMGWSIVPIALARLGMTEHLETAFEAHIEKFQQFPSGLWNYHDTQTTAATDMAATSTVFDRGDESNQFEFPSEPHTHFGLEPGAVIQTTINEMLLQSYDGTIRLCPAALESWNGAFTLWAQGGFRVSAVVENGQAVSAEIMSVRGESCVLSPVSDNVAGWQVIDGDTGAVVPTAIEADAITFDTEESKTYRIVSPEHEWEPMPEFTAERNEQAKQRGSRWIGIPRKW
jgi:alpha-L-fucosidase 2